MKGSSKLPTKTSGNETCPPSNLDPFGAFGLGAFGPGLNTNATSNTCGTGATRNAHAPSASGFQISTKTFVALGPGEVIRFYSLPVLFFSLFSFYFVLMFFFFCSLKRRSLGFKPFSSRVLDVETVGSSIAFKEGPNREYFMGSRLQKKKKTFRQSKKRRGKRREQGENKT